MKTTELGKVIQALRQGLHYYNKQEVNKKGEHDFKLFSDAIDLCAKELEEDKQEFKGMSLKDVDFYFDNHINKKE